VTDRRIRMAAALGIAAWSLGLNAQAPSPAEARLRDQLRSTTLELRQLQAEQQELQAQLQDARQQLATLRTQSGQAQQAASAEQGRNLALSNQVDQLRDALGKWQASQKQALELAHARDAEARRLDGELQQVKAEQAVCHNDNVELVDVSQNLLDAYAHKGFGAVLKDAEPVTGLGHVRFETLAQTYHARIVNATLPPEDAAAAPAAEGGSQ